MTYDFSIPTDLYFLHRLAVTSQAQAPGEVQYDLARSQADQPTLTSTAQAFGAPQPQNNWGLASFASHLAATQPQAVKTYDLKGVQSKLQQAGYLPTDYQVNDQWDPAANAAFSHWENDQTQNFYGGQHMGSTTTQKALEAMGWMLPSRVFQGLVGAAKGFVEQTPQTVERLGAAGGAVAGAAIGGAAGLAFGGIGAVPGAAIGAGIGAAVGFFSDLLTKTPEENQSSGLEQLWNAIVPYKEYTGTGGFGRFMEDLGWIGTASSLVAGVGGGVAAAAGGVADVGAAADAAGTSWWGAAMASQTPEDVGWSSKLIANSARLVGGTDRYTQMMEFFKTRGLMAQAARPILADVVTPLYTGLSSAQIGARVTSNLGAGENETTIHKAISTEPLHTGPQIGPLGGLVDLAGFVIQPTQFLPVKLGDLARGINGLSEADPAFQALIDTTRVDTPGLSQADAANQITSMMGRTPAEVESKFTMMKLEYGVEAKAYELAKEQGGGLSREEFLRAMEDHKNDVREQILTDLNPGAVTSGDVSSEGLLHSAATEEQAAKMEAARAGKPSLAKSIQDRQLEPIPGSANPMLRDVMSRATTDPAGFAAYIQRLTNNGSGVEGLQSYFDATQVTKAYTDGVRDGSLIPMDSEGKLVNPGSLTAGSSGEIHRATMDLKTLDAQISKLETFTNERVSNPVQVEENMAELRDLQKQREDLQSALTELRKKSPANWDDRIIVPERLDTPTRSDYVDKARTWGQIQSGLEIAKQENNGTALRFGLRAKEMFLQQNQDLIPGAMLERALEGSQAKDEVGTFLARQAQHASEEIHFNDPTISSIVPQGALDPGVEQRLHDMGYKAVVRHSRNSFEYMDDPRITEVTGINDYTKRPAFWESMGLGASKSDDSSLAQLRTANIEKSVDQLSQTKGWGLSGKNILGRLYRALDEANYSGTVTNDVARGLTERGDPVSIRAGFLIPSSGKARHFAVDMRDLKPQDVYEAMHDIPGFTHADAADLFGSLQKGGTFGADLNFYRDPVGATHQLGRVMRINGWQGFTDVARKLHTSSDAADAKFLSSYNAKRLAVGAGAGAALGYFQGNHTVDSALKGAGVGLATGLGVSWLARKSYGYIPDYLYHVMTAIRYSLSPSFDVRRFVKQNLLAATTHDLPPMMNGPRSIKAGEWDSLYSSGKVSGEQAWSEAKKYWGELNNVDYNEALDTFDRSLYAAGITGYNPMNRMMAHAYVLKGRGLSDEAVRNAIGDIYTYGAGRSAMEKSINYVFFPFSFEKKLLTNMGDFILQRPARALLLYEGAKRFYDSTWAKDVQGYMNKHVPLLSTLGEFNAFAHGIGPGRFLWEGLGEHRTIEGKAAQLLASFFVPGGGAATPLHQAFGALGDVAAHAFSPVVVTGESISKIGGNLDANESAGQALKDIATKYIPFTRDLNQIFSQAYDQVFNAMAHGESQWSQISDYYDGVRQAKDKMNPLAQALGYTDADGLMQSDNPLAVGVKDQYQSELEQLQKQFPAGWAAAQTFDNRQGVIDAAKRDILESSNTSAAYSAMKQIISMEQSGQSLAAQVQDPTLTDVFQRSTTDQIRQIALQHAGDPRFNELWQQLFQYTYGPITSEVAA